MSLTEHIGISRAQCQFIKPDERRSNVESNGNQVFSKSIGVFICLIAFTASPANAQTTYHFHQEIVIGGGLRNLVTTPPDSATFTIQSAELKNVAPSDRLVGDFMTPPGVPNATGTIAASSTVTFSVWMRKTAATGAMIIKPQLWVMNYENGQFVYKGDVGTCNGPVLTTTLTKHTITCTTNASIDVAASNQLSLRIFATITQSATKNCKVELSVEGANGGNYDSTVIVPAIVPPPPPPSPPPIINNVSPVSGQAGATVTVTGVNFGAAPGLITFNGVSGTGTTWAATSIVTHVPSGAATGPLVVTTGGGASNTVTFTIAGVGTLSGTVTRAAGGGPVSGALVEVLQSGVVKASQTTTSNGGYSVANLPSGFYDLRVTAPGLLPAVRTGLGVGGGTTVGDVTLVEGGSANGMVTDAATGTPVAGASLSAVQGGSLVRTATTDSNGAFLLEALTPGVYTVDAHAIGYNVKTTTGVTVTAGQASVVNVTLNALAASSIRYAYDDADRLIAVVNPAGEAARYTYDAVGNLLTISRESATGVLVTGLNPQRGPAGTTVIISGNGFSSTAAQNSVTFGGVSATVSAATEVSLTVTVPNGLANGAASVVVTSPSGTGAAPISFNVSPTDAPIVNSFAPAIGGPGTAVTINGLNFSSTLSENSAEINITQAPVTSATTTTLATTVPVNARTGYWSVFTRKGMGKSSTPFFVPPAPYQPSDVAVTQVIAFGVPTTVTIPTAGKIALLAFDGVAGHRLAITHDWSNGSCSSTLTLYDTRLEPHPSGVVDSGLPVDIAGYIDGRVLPYTGAYTLVWKLCPTGTGTSTITLTEVPNDAAASIAANAQPVSVNTVLGQNARVTFAGTAGQRVTLYQASGSVRTYLMEPGQWWGSQQAFGTGWLGPVGLQASGLHTLFVDPQGLTTGTTTLTLYNVPADPTSPITPGGVPVTRAIEAPGNRLTLTFNGTAGQIVSISHQQPTMSALSLFVYDQSTPGNPFVNTFSSDFIDATTLPAAATYVIDVSPWTFGQTGDIMVQLYNVPPSYVGTLTIGASPTPISTSVPGQNVELTFSGTANQQATVRLESSTFNCTDVRLFRGTVQLTTAFACGTTLTLPTQTLPATDSYRVVVDPRGMNTGSGTIRVTNP